MSRIHVCAGCQARDNGVKSRIEIPHTCGEAWNIDTVAYDTATRSMAILTKDGTIKSYPPRYPKGYDSLPEGMNQPSDGLPIKRFS